MTDWLNGAPGLVLALPALAYAAALLAAAAQVLPRAAAPGGLAIVGLGVLAPSGIVAFWPLAFVVAAGASAGDGAAFLIGRRRGAQAGRLRPTPGRPGAWEKSEALLKRHGPRAVLLATFTPATRAILPRVAGAQNMSGLWLHPFNIASRLVWALAHVGAGLLIGAALAALGPLAAPLSIVAAILAAIVWLLFRAARYALRRGLPLLVRAADRLRARALAREGWPWRLLARALDPNRNEAQLLALLSAALAASAWLFFAVLEDVATGDQPLHIDTIVYRLLQDLRTPTGDRLMVAVTELGDTIVTLGIAFTVFLWLAWRRAWRTSLYWLGAVVGATVLNVAIKGTLQRARPGDLLYSGWSAFSFPSGHTTANMVLYGFLAFLAASGAGPVRRRKVVLGAVTLVILIAFSRLYLGAHWFSDVAGGLAFGGAFVALLGLFYLRGGREAVPPGRLLAVASCALLVIGGLNIAMQHESDLRRYAAADPSPAFTAEQWIASQWRRLPAYRVTLAGERAEPLTLQWAGPLHGLRERLLRAGWRSPARWSATSVLGRVGGATDDPPVAPAFASGRLPSLTLVREGGAGDGKSRLALRVWASGEALDAGRPTPLWLGSVVEEPATPAFSPARSAGRPADADAPREALAAALPDARLVMRAAAERNGAGNGGVLLAGPGLADGR